MRSPLRTRPAALLALIALSSSLATGKTLAEDGEKVIVGRSPQIDRSIEDPERIETEDDRRRFYGSVGIGADFSRGDYGEPDKTNILSVPAFLKLEYEPITAKVLVPFVLIDGSEGVVVGEGGEGSGQGRDLRYGLGDIIASLSYSWFPSRDYVPIVDVTTKLKIPTGSKSDGIGTGKVDATFQLDVTETIGPVSIFGGGGYRLKGGGRYDDIWLASAGASVRLGRPMSLGVAYDYREASTSTTGDSHEIAPFASLRLGSRYRLGPYGVIGLSQNSPDWGAGMTFSVDF